CAFFLSRRQIMEPKVPNVPCADPCAERPHRRDLMNSVAREMLPFSCKGRAWCPSCGGRRMTERAAHLVDAVVPWVPVRQWVLTVLCRLRYQLAWNHGLSRAVLRVYTRVLRYVLRPPFAQERLRLRSDGRVALELKTAWHDGTRELVFEPLEFLERLAAMTPRPETNLLICHGVLAPRACWRKRVVAYGRVEPEPTASGPPRAAGPGSPGVKSRPRAWTWAALMHRPFPIRVLRWPDGAVRLTSG